jgi:hypothetical protein
MLSYTCLNHPILGCPKGLLLLNFNPNALFSILVLSNLFTQPSYCHRSPSDSDNKLRIPTSSLQNSFLFLHIFPLPQYLFHFLSLSGLFYDAVNMSYFPGICFKGLRNTIKNVSVTMQVSQPRLKLSTSQIHVQRITTTEQSPQFCFAGRDILRILPTVVYLSALKSSLQNTFIFRILYFKSDNIQSIDDNSRSYICCSYCAHFVLTWLIARQTWRDSMPAQWRSMQGECCMSDPASRSQTHWCSGHSTELYPWRNPTKQTILYSCFCRPFCENREWSSAATLPIPSVSDLSIYIQATCTMSAKLHN